MTGPAGLTAEQRKLRDEENDYREKFVSARDHPSIANPYVMLMDVYKNESRFVYQGLTPEEDAIPKLLTKHQRKNPINQPAIVNEATFMRNWDDITKKMFSGMDWSNIFCAGGSVVASLNSTRGSASSDIDLFIWGTRSDEEANERVRHIHQTLQRNTKSKGDVIRTARAITFIGEYPYRHVQVILRRYKSPAEVLLGFDIDSCCAGFDGNRVWVLERFRRAITKGYNLCDPLRRSSTYESRLLKYSQRGFIALVPDLDKDRVDPSIYERSITEAEGLMKLLIYDYQENLTWCKPIISATKFQKKLLKAYSGDEELEQMGHISDYCELAIPWGPNWFSGKIIQHLQAIDKAKLFGTGHGGLTQHRHIFVTGIDGVLEGIGKHNVWCVHCRNQVKLSAGDRLGDDEFVFGKLTWGEKTPVLQDFDHGRVRTLMTGSFTVKVQIQWDKDVYLPSGSGGSMQTFQPTFRIPPQQFPTKIETPTGGKPPRRSSSRSPSPIRKVKEPKEPKAATKIVAGVSHDFAGAPAAHKCEVCGNSFQSVNLLLRHYKVTGHRTLTKIETTSIPESTVREVEKLVTTTTGEISIFKNMFFSIHGVDFNVKQGLMKLIMSNGGRYSYSVSQRTSFVITTPDEVKVKPFGIAKALEYRIPIVSPHFILDCITEQKILDFNSYLIEIEEAGADSEPAEKLVALSELIQLQSTIPRNKLLENYCFSVRGFPAATKTALLKVLYKCSAHYSYLINNKVTHVITTNKELNTNIFLGGLKEKFTVEFISIDFILDTATKRQLQDEEPYILLPPERPEQSTTFAAFGVDDERDGDDDDERETVEEKTEDKPTTGYRLSVASEGVRSYVAKERSPISSPPAQPSPFLAQGKPTEIKRLSFDDEDEDEDEENESEFKRPGLEAASEEDGDEDEENEEEDEEEPEFKPKLLQTLAGRSRVPTPQMRKTGAFSNIRKVSSSVGPRIGKTPMKGKAYNYRDTSIFFPEDYTIVKNDVLQVTRINTNNNKYYVLELHKAEHNGVGYFRVFSHFGRTDDLAKNPNAGIRQCRYSSTFEAAEAEYNGLLRRKTGHVKGYKKVDVKFTANLGSDKARELARKADEEALKSPAISTLPKPILRLVKYIYDEAVKTLTTTIAANITSRGIETPLGILSLAQVLEGEKILSKIREEVAKPSPSHSVLTELSGAFLTAIPHNVGGRSASAIAAATIRTIEAVNEKEELLQLMKDMIQINSSGALFAHDYDAKYIALRNQITFVEPGTSLHHEIREFVENSQVVSRQIKVENIYTLNRQVESERFKADVGGTRWLFHGSRICNWVGLLSRGLLLPQAVAKFGVTKSVASGWLGNGIYFASAADTSVKYTTSGSEGTRLMLVCNVALGNIKHYNKITYDLNSAPDDFHSTHGVRAAPGEPSDFSDDEYVVYDVAQQMQLYLIEFSV